MSVTRDKVQAGTYMLTAGGVTYRAVKADAGWVVRCEDGDAPTTTVDRLKDAEAWVEQVDVEADIPDGCVAWTVPSNRNSRLHRLPEGTDPAEATETACGLDVPDDGRSLAVEPSAECGHCFS